MLFFRANSYAKPFLNEPISYEIGGGEAESEKELGKKMKTIESNLIHIIGYWYLSD